MIRKPCKEDLPQIERILLQWTTPDEATKYCQRIASEIDEIIEFNTRFWVIIENENIIGVGGISDILPKISTLQKTDAALEIKILYLDNQNRGKGYGKLLLEFLENECQTRNAKEILIRSAQQYGASAYGFYQSQGYTQVGTIDNDMAVFQKVL